MKKGIIQRCALLPVNVIATALGFATLANMWGAAGFNGVRDVSFAVVSLVWLAAIVKMSVHFPTFKADYLLLVPSSLYATFSMLTMVLGGFVFELVPAAGRALWLAGVALHTLHLIIFTSRFVIKGVILDTFLPTWFVTYAGYMVAIVSGMPMGFPLVLQWVMLYGFVVYPIILVGMLVRLYKKPLPVILKPTGAIFLAPSSLFFVSYLNMSPSMLPNLAPQIDDAIVVGIYIILFITIIRVATLLPSYLRDPFGPGLAALTFPTAIALVATFRMVGYLEMSGRGELAGLLQQFFGIQLYITTAIMVYVGYNFLFPFLDSYRPPKPPAPSNYDAAKLEQGGL
ncbi:MAG: TDT family transporter [Spirochaetes bacterium]|nr:TDT family transporter [Spirochaetota bacterium]